MKKRKATKAKSKPAKAKVNPKLAQASDDIANLITKRNAQGESSAIDPDFNWLVRIVAQLIDSLK